jgi:ribosomal protein L40E
MTIITCYQCGAQNSDADVVCKHCGVNLRQKTKCPTCGTVVDAASCKSARETPPAKPESWADRQRSSATESLGQMAILGGIAGAVYFTAFFDTSVGSPIGRIINLDLAQQQKSGLMVSIAAAVLGGLLIISGKLGQKRPK